MEDVMSDSLLKQSLDKRGLQRKNLRHLEGIPYSYAVKHYNGDCPVSAQYALLYEAQLGIPRYELRPDLWSPAMFRFLAPSAEEAGTPAQKPAPAV